MTQSRPIRLFSGNANLPLAKKIAHYLNVPLGDASISRFADGEVAVDINESVRNEKVYLLQSTCAPVNENLFELLVLVDALKRASACEITAVIPYYGYARQDRKTAPRQPITAKLVANLLQAAGITRVLSVDLHAGQIQGFFDVPYDHLYAMPIFIDHIRQQFCLNNNCSDEFVIVSPDAGGVERARAYAKRLQADLAIIDKRRPKAGVAEIMNIIGEIGDKKAIIIDDMIDSAGTLTKAAAALQEKGALEVHAYATHPVFSPPALERIENSNLKSVVVSDSIPLHPDAAKSKKIEVLSCANIVGEAILRIHCGQSVSSLFV